MIDNEKAKNPQQTQIETIAKYLSGVKHVEIFDLSMKIYPVISTRQPYSSLYNAIKKQVLITRGKGVMFEQIGSQLVAKAYSVSDNLGDQICVILQKQPQFLLRFQQSNNSNNTTTVDQPVTNIQPQQEKKQVTITNPTETITIPNKEIPIVQHFPPNPPKSPVQQNFTPILAPLRNQFNSNSPLQSFVQSPQQLNDMSVYKIGFRPHQQKVISNNNNNPPVISNGHNYNTRQQQKKYNTQQQKKQVPKGNQKQKQSSSGWKEYADLLTKKKNDAERVIKTIGDPLSSGRPATTSPSKPILSPAHLFQQRISQMPKPPQKSSFFTTYQQQQKSKNNRIVDKYITDQNLMRNLSNKQACICETACENIVLSQDSFVCIHCQNVYHTRCMKKTKQSKNCSICHMRLMIPNKVVCQQFFVGLMKKGRKKHEMVFELNEQVVSFLKSKKQSPHKLQIRCLRLKQQTQNQNLFPDNCTVSINGKQLKQFKPLHKQSSLKYRKDEPILILKNFQVGENKIVITEFHSTSSSVSSLERIQPQDHLIGLYIIEEEQLNATVERIVANFTTTLQESKNILNKSFYINDEQKSIQQMSQSEAISCQVLKIPLTCALTTEKLNYPARGVFCQHFQCFDLKNFIMMTSASSYPRWVCPICKASCYQFKIDCILTEILNQYAHCNKVETLVLYKNGIYQVLDKDEDPIDVKGNKLKQSLQRNISQLKIVDLLKRQREKQAERQLLKQQQAEKKKKRIIELPPEDQIVSLLSDSQGQC